MKIIAELITESIKGLGVVPRGGIELTSPKEEAFGDFSTSAAMGIAKALKKNPREIAAKIAEGIKRPDVFQKIEVAGPGFINFTLSEEFRSEAIKVLLKDGPAIENIGGGRRVQIEFVSANPTGPLHLGHGRGAALGSALSNLLARGGYKVEREYYINDAGRQVKLLAQSVYARYKELLGLGSSFPEDGYRGDYVIEIAKGLLDKEGDKFGKLSFEECERSIAEFSLGEMLGLIKKDLEGFGVFFDIWQSERGLFESGEVKDTLNYLLEKGFLYESESALWFKATAFGDEKDRVVVKGDGEYTYFASDIAYHMKKVKGGYDELIDIWGADHHGYIPRIKAVIEALGYDKEKLKVLLVQMVSLTRGGKPVPMSKRSGEFVTLQEVIDEVGADTTKFIFLTRRPDSHLNFDLEAAKAASAENPVYYVQYANARIKSIFAYSADNGMGLSSLGDSDLGLLNAPEEVRVIKKLLTYTMVLEGAVKAHEPHRITFYLQELAGLFHQYYNLHRVVTEGGELTKARLSLCQAVSLVLADGLGILGVAVPDRM